jgi:hypothetical protein
MAYAVGVALIVAAAFGAAVVAAQANGITSRTWTIVLLSVLLSQAITFVQGRKLPRRAVIAALERVETMPAGVHRTSIVVRASEAGRLSAALLAHGFLHVEQVYYRNADTATLVAYVDREKGHAHMQAAPALGSAWHELGAIVGHGE